VVSRADRTPNEEHAPVLPDASHEHFRHEPFELMSMLRHQVVDLCMGQLTSL